ncbi:hypothetical protein ABZ863_24540 [Saccharomonospora sp. NPDC046836]|uniref:hypothetical protein n=1 Tax=Saccharomonospora sp. NPDC046836 TaxID=3156921 RepID=UPI0033D12C9F
MVVNNPVDQPRDHFRRIYAVADRVEETGRGAVQGSVQHHGLRVLLWELAWRAKALSELANLAVHKTAPTTPENALVLAERLTPVAKAVTHTRHARALGLASPHREADCLTATNRAQNAFTRADGDEPDWISYYSQAHLDRDIGRAHLHLALGSGDHTAAQTRESNAEQPILNEVRWLQERLGATDWRGSDRYGATVAEDDVKPMRVGVYVDAFNVYYDARSHCGRGTAGWRWLDLAGLAMSLINPRVWPGATLERLVYCTAPRDREGDSTSRQDQQVYVEALHQHTPQLEVVNGKYAPRTKTGVLVAKARNGRPVRRVGSPGAAQMPSWLPAEEITGPQGHQELLVTVSTFEEKGSDVNVASHLLIECSPDASTRRWCCRTTRICTSRSGTPANTSPWPR